MKLYIAGPLFNEMERERNEVITGAVEECGVLTYLPQRDAGVFSKRLNEGKNIEEIRKEIFLQDLEALKKCDGILCLLDGRVPDEGMCIELGIAYTMGKQCIAYRTDSRISEYDKLNIILEGCLQEIFSTKEALQTYCRKHFQ